MNNKPKYACSILVLGDLGKPASISLESLTNVESVTICVICDEAGKTWLLQNSSTLIRNKLCFHFNSEIEDKLSCLDKDVEYVSFGNPRFFKLMILKWLLILDCFKRHEDLDVCIYTDLDVYWRKDPRETIHNLLGSHFLALIQDDSSLSGDREFFCPGIMVWKNQNGAKSAIREIYDFQEREINSGKPYPDDKALNNWIKQENNRLLIDFLPPKLYVIGHRIIWLLLGRQGFSMRGIIAFHGNYSVGLREKLILMKAASLSPYSILRIFYTIYFILKKLNSRR